MIEGIAGIVEEYWQPVQATFRGRLAEALRGISRILEAEKLNREGRESVDETGRTLGNFGVKSLDVESINSLLLKRRSLNSIPDERYQRVKKIAAELEKIEKSHRENPPQCQFVDLKDDIPAILEQFESHLNHHSQTIRVLRQARLESKAKYDSTIHDQLFENFDWRRLDSEEMTFSPPFVVFVGSEKKGSLYGDIMQLVSSGRPIKLVVAGESSLNGISETGRAAALKFEPSLELFCTSLRYVFFAQSPGIGDKRFIESLNRGLQSPRPGLFSVLTGSAGGPGEVENGNRGRCNRALASRAFPIMDYDPERAAEFVACLSLEGNPDPGETWPKETLEYQGENGENLKLEREFTFADFAVREERFKAQFQPPSAGIEEEKMVKLADYFRLSRQNRKSKTPFINVFDGEKRLVKLVPSWEMIALTADKMSQWHSLQELTGIRNPHVATAEKIAREEAAKENEESTAKLKLELEQQMREKEKAAVATAMRNLVIKLTSLKDSGQTLEDLLFGAVEPASQPPPESPAETAAPAQPIAPEPQAEEPSAPPGDIAWIETEDCTTCDDCITINKNIFVYNSDKKAIIKDARGGPFRDIVKAAEKCPAFIIHPGQPLDPKEKDLDKWVKRAEKFQ